MRFPLPKGTQWLACYRPVGLTTGFAAAIALALSSCAATSESSRLETAQSDEPLQIVTTFLPITDFTQAVAGDRAQVTQLLPTTVGPHDYQAKPQDAQRLAAADVLVENGLELEGFLEDLIANAASPDLTVIDSSEGIPTLAAGEAEHEDGHEDGHEGEDEEGHEHGEFDPHIWLDPKKAIQQVENIRDGLIAADPAGKDTYTANAAAYIAQLQALDQSFTTALAPYADQTFVTYHDFANHLAQSYNLKVEHLVSVPEDNAAPADVQRVIEAVQASNLKTLLSEPQEQGSPFEALSGDLGVQVSIFDPMETSGPEGLTAGYYLTTMGKNLDNLEAAFGKAAP
ncbi:zinc ABC transporter substrate-binding protein [Leptolyngbya sp. BC1307]|uniref:metal ABC transporter solute-binding protein, Zn/Mn family n=1 Tax=Leptolyngbya sp. BC1307 TaxID=2029589 RepID=UPI000EFD7876|nr:zinc ABC transporter substrate-binding protein [Leptolyngbya sp. BC1307]